MGKGANFNIQECSSKDESKQETFYSWSEIKDNKKWIVIDGKVYDVSKFSKKHPGGERLMMNHIGQDASVRNISLKLFIFLFEFYKCMFWFRMHLQLFIMI